MSIIGTFRYVPCVVRDSALHHSSLRQHCGGTCGHAVESVNQHRLQRFHVAHQHPHPCLQRVEEDQPDYRDEQARGGSQQCLCDPSQPPQPIPTASSHKMRTSRRSRADQDQSGYEHRHPWLVDRRTRLHRGTTIRAKDDGSYDSRLASRSGRANDGAD